MFLIILFVTLYLTGMSRKKTDERVVGRTGWKVGRTGWEVGRTGWEVEQRDGWTNDGVGRMDGRTDGGEGRGSHGLRFHSGYGRG